MNTSVIEGIEEALCDRGLSSGKINDMMVDIKEEIYDFSLINQYADYEFYIH